MNAKQRQRDKARQDRKTQVLEVAPPPSSRQVPWEKKRWAAGGGGGGGGVGREARVPLRLLLLLHWRNMDNTRWMMNERERGRG